jgi:hypothetical protein
MSWTLSMREEQSVKWPLLSSACRQFSLSIMMMDDDDDSTKGGDVGGCCVMRQTRKASSVLLDRPSSVKRAGAIFNF